MEGGTNVASIQVEAAEQIRTPWSGCWETLHWMCVLLPSIGGFQPPWLPPCPLPHKLVLCHSKLPMPHLLFLCVCEISSERSHLESHKQRGVRALKGLPDFPQ